MADTGLIAPDIPANRTAVAGAPDGVEVHLFAVPPLSRGRPARLLRYVRAAADDLSLALGEGDAFAQDAKAEAMVARSDVVETHWSETLPLIPRIQAWAPRVKVVAFEQDVRYQSLSRRASTGDHLRDRFLATVAARRVRRREPAYLNRVCDGPDLHPEGRRPAPPARGRDTDRPPHALPRPPPTAVAPCSRAHGPVRGRVRPAGELRERDVGS